MQTKEELDAPLIVHLEALRQTLIRCIVALAAGLIPGLIAAPRLLELLSRRITEGVHVSLHYFAPMEVFLLQLKLALLIDAVVCFPYVIWQIWKFILPALYEKERKFLRALVWISSLLFALGIAFFLTLCFPLLLQFGASFSSESIVPIFGISNIVSLGLWLSLAFGCMFQFPIVTYSLIRSGIVSYETVCDKRPYVIVGILILAAILTPPDVVSQLMLGIPTYLLFESGLLFARKFRGRILVERHEPIAPNQGSKNVSPGVVGKAPSRPSNAGIPSNSLGQNSPQSSAAQSDIDFTRPTSPYQTGTVKSSEKFKPN